jgi:hypothetical protein
LADALMSGKAMEPVIEDWVDRYEEEQDQALGELVVFLIRVRGPSVILVVQIVRTRLTLSILL